MPEDGIGVIKRYAMNLLYFVFGPRLDNHQMVQHSILSFLSKRGNADGHVYVMTDYPDLYKRYSQYVEILPLTSQQIEEWKGEHKFFWRAKIKAIQMVGEIVSKSDTPAPLVYLDGDTFFFGDVSAMENTLKGGKGMMHLDEGHPSNMKTKSLAMWKTVSGHTYSGVKIGKEHNMWNAGVVAIPADKLIEVPQLALNICDGMLDDGAEPIVVEQYSLSIALKELCGLAPASTCIGHYWGNKPQWLEHINNMFNESFMQNRTVEDDIECIEIDRMMQNIPVYAHYSSWRGRFQKKLNKMFAHPKVVRYANQR